MSMWTKDPKYVEGLLNYYKTLEGASIEGISFEKDEFDDYILWPTLTIRFTDGSVRKVYVQADPEGNREGFLSGLPED